MPRARPANLDSRSISSFDSDDPNAKVYVDGVEIPTAEKTLYARNEGPLDFTRYLECEFASPWHGEHYTRLFDTLTEEDQDGYGTVRVDVKDPATGDHVPSFWGYVTGVGSTSHSIPSLWKIRAQGPGHLLKRLPADKGFSRDASAADVLHYVKDTLDSELSFNVSLDVLTNVQASNETSQDSTTDSDPAAGYPGHYQGSDQRSERDFPNVATSKTFQYGRDTLADVIRWITRKTGTYAWFAPTPDGPTLVVADNPRTNHHKASYLDGGSIRIESNDALSEIKPVNTIVCKSPAKASTGRETNKIAIVRARHKGLYRRAGNTELLTEPHRLSDAHTTAELENEARKRLKTALSETTEGTMQTIVAPTVTPYDTIEAVPTAEGTAADNLSPITYEVTRVEHSIDSGPFPRSKLHVGVHTEPSEDIEIIASYTEARGE